MEKKIIKKENIYNKRLIVFFYILFTLFLKCESFIDPMKHDITVYTERNFDGKVQKFRKSHVFIIYAYNLNAEAKKFILGDLNDIAKDLKGMVNVGVVNCNEWKMFCEPPTVPQIPSLLIYPSHPFPAFPYTGTLKKDDIKQKVLPLIPDKNVRKIDDTNIEKFISENPSIPKVILFTNKAKPPALYNALGNAFENKLLFGFVDAQNSTNSVLLTRYNVKELPHLIVIKSDKKSNIYKGEIKFRNIHDWLNIFSETFVTGGGYSDSDTTSNARPWLMQKIPEVTKLSHQDVCFKKGKGLCVIYLRNGEGITGEEISMLEELESEFTSHVSDRGINFRWMWMNVDIEKEFAKMLNISKYPSVVVFNPFKRLRYTKIETEATKDSIESLVNKIAGGDARFTNVPDQKLPPFADREEPKKRDKREEL